MTLAELLAVYGNLLRCIHAFSKRGTLLTDLRVSDPYFFVHALNDQVKGSILPVWKEFVVSMVIISETNRADELAQLTEMAVLTQLTKLTELTILT